MDEVEHGDVHLFSNLGVTWNSFAWASARIAAGRWWASIQLVLSIESRMVNMRLVTYSTLILLYHVRRLDMNYRWRRQRSRECRNNLVSKFVLHRETSRRIFQPSKRAFATGFNITQQKDFSSIGWWKTRLWMGKERLAPQASRCIFQNSFGVQEIKIWWKQDNGGNPKMHCALMTRMRTSDLCKAVLEVKPVDGEGWGPNVLGHKQSESVCWLYPRLLEAFQTFDN
jgi:hypothetical protein